MLRLRVVELRQQPFLGINVVGDLVVLKCFWEFVLRFFRIIFDVKDLEFGFFGSEIIGGNLFGGIVCSF